MFKKALIAIVMFVVLVHSSEINRLFSQNLEGMYNNITWVSEVKTNLYSVEGDEIITTQRNLLFGIVKTTTEDRYGDPLHIYNYVIGISIQPLDIIKSRTEQIDVLICNVVIPQYIDYVGNKAKQFRNNPQNPEGLKQEKWYTVTFSFAVSKDNFGMLYAFPQNSGSFVGKITENSYGVYTVIPILLKDLGINGFIIPMNDKTVESIEEVKNQMKIFESRQKNY